MKKQSGIVKVLWIMLILSLLIYGCYEYSTDRRMLDVEDISSNSKIYLIPLPGTCILMPYVIQQKTK